MCFLFNFKLIVVKLYRFHYFNEFPLLISKINLTKKKNWGKKYNRINKMYFVGSFKLDKFT